MTDHELHPLLPHLFRLEYTKMTAVICRLFGLQHMEIAEDIVSDTFLKATELWSFKGIPENPTAWLYSVAKNKTKDYLKRHGLFQQQVLPRLQVSQPDVYEMAIDFTDQNIKDSQLAMIFAVCDPAINEPSQISLALQVLCGFGVEEIANAFLSNKETVKKRLFRARENLREQSFSLHALNEQQITERLDTVLTTLYLLFNEGYFSKSKDHIIREDLCFEAIRLTLLLTENQLTDLPKVNALLALLYFHSSRLAARLNESQELVLFEEQDRSLWDRNLINKGNYYLVKACQGNVLSRYHLEASIAYWHTAPDQTEKWKYILQLYDELLSLEYSPVTALNRVFALAKVNGHPAAIAAAEQLALASTEYHALLGYLYKPVDREKAVAHYEQAIALSGSGAEKKQFRKAIEESSKF